MTSTRETTTLSTHVLDTSLGAPARGLRVVLERVDEHGEVEIVGTGITDDDGRLRDVAGGDGSLREGTYRLRFDTGHYFAHHERETLYPEVAIVIRVGASVQHYHVPLLLSPFGYTTYRGS
jgi:5-hydroxyisourate hydrolase